MRTILLLTLTLAACGPATRSGEGVSAGIDDGRGQPPETPLRPASEVPEAVSGEWRLGQDAVTFFDAEGDSPLVEIACRQGALVVRLPGVRPIPSEERLSFGGGGDVEALVAVAAGGGGVEARGAIPPRDQLDALMKAGPGASYGATAIGPLAPVPDDIRRALLDGCR